MVYIPLISTRKPRRDLEPRAGGGGGGRGGGGGGGGKGGGSSSGGKGGSSGSSGSSSGGRSSSISAGGTSKSASTYSRGGGSVVTIPNGSPFAGRQQGGGSRDQIYGTRYVKNVCGGGVQMLMHVTLLQAVRERLSWCQWTRGRGTELPLLLLALDVRWRRCCRRPSLS